VTFQHLFWANKRVAHGCRLLGLADDEMRFQIAKGISRREDFPACAHYMMNPDFPDGTITTDQLPNQSAQIVVAERLRDFLVARKVPEVEYLPVAIHDHRGRPVRSSYFIVHPVGVVDVLDREACGITWDFTGQSVQRITSFVVQQAAERDLRPITRVAFMSGYLAVHRALAQRILDAGFTGSGFVEPDALVGKRLAPNLWVS
jgi:hypothetical protein